jgi:Fur family peroxide stress response transcriptional regulator
LDTKELFEIFREKGLRLTIQRLVIFNSIISRKDHPTTEEIYNSLKDKFPTISLGTIYKTLHLFKELNLIQELNFSENNIRYDPNMSLHINIVCPKCGKICDYNNEKIKDIWQVIISDLNIKPKGQRIDIYSECEGCKILNAKGKK